MSFCRRASRLAAPVLLALGLLPGGCGSSAGESFVCLDLSSAPAEADTAKPKDFLAGPYTKLAIEIDYDTIVPPEGDILEAFRSYIAARVEPKTVEVEVRQIAHVKADGPPTIEELRAAEALTRRAATGGDTIVLHVLYLTESVPGYGGFQLRPSSFCVLGADEHEPPQHLCALVHETGHVLGLVGNGAPAIVAHMTGDHVHCTNPGCAMQPVLSNAGTYCEDCLADLRRIGGH
ncbi:MAG TPA: hypothetical protein VHF22_02030 [Planctomycetota bacterium]|nr:hypothetical protein [Planctomycetota bacterium]